MGMGMSQHLSLSQDLEMTLDQRISQKMGLVQSLSLTMNQIFHESDAAPENYYDTLIRFLATRINNPGLKQGFLEFLTNPFVGTRLINSREERLADLLEPNLNTLKEVAVDAMFQMTKGEFGQDPSHRIQLDAVTMRQAFFDPAYLESEIKKQTDLLRDVASGGALMEEIRVKQDALRLADALGPMVTNITTLLGLGFDIKDAQGNSYLGAFFRDMLIVEKLQYIVADRTMARFAARFLPISKKSDPKEHYPAFINVIFEFMMTSIGVISPKLFNLQHAKDEVDIAVLANSDEELRQIYSHYNLSRKEVFFWNRWAVVGVRPSRITDNMIRGLLRVFQVEEGPRLIEISGFDEVFNDIMDIKEELSNDYITKEEAQENMHSLVVHVLTGQELTKEIAGLLKERWYQLLVDLGFSTGHRRNPYHF
jgi:hypothetical protein